MEVGVNVPISVTNNAPHTGNELRIWVDWNIDADFEDSDELVYASGPLGITTYNTSFAPPQHARIGITRMRIRLHDTAFGPNTTPCDVANLGEVEDYSILVKETMVGILDPDEFKTVMIHPNPANSELLITIPKGNIDRQMRILDIFGKVYFEGSISISTTIDIDPFAPGVYFIAFDADSNLPVYKFIKVE